MYTGGASMALFPNGKSTISSMSTETQKMGLLKKVEELSVLCGVKSCAIIYTSDIDLNPQTWPAGSSQVQMFLTKLKSLPEYEQIRFSSNVDTLLEQRIEKAKIKLSRLMRESKVKQAREDMSHLLDGRKLSISLDGYRDLSLAIDRALKDVKRRVEELRSKREDTDENNFSKCSNLEIFGMPVLQKCASQELMKVVDDEMDSLEGLDHDHMESSLLYLSGTTNEHDLIGNFNVDDFKFYFEEDQLF